MDSYSDTQGIFRQLAETESPVAVRSVIENHEAWVQSETVGRMLAGVINARGVSARVLLQRKRLACLVTVLPSKLASAG